jgi:anaerobic magnesium-protoporphyrin IX monomethyl ester cyclase
VLVLLTHANHLYSDRKQVRKMQPYAPLQTLIAASRLRSEGFQVALHDTTFDADIRSSIERTRPDFVIVAEDNFNFLTKMCLLQNRERSFEIARVAAGFGIPALVNSSDAADHAAEYLNAGFEQVILGELEDTLSDALRHWPSPVPGVARHSNERAEFTAPRAPIRDLDQLPPPAWDLVDLDRYRRAWVDAHGFFSMNLVASRGCPYRCNWCAKPVYGDSYRHYSAARAAAELECVKSLFDPDQIWFADDIFGLSAKWIREFAACVERRGAYVPFRMQSRCDLMTGDAPEYLRRSGCIEVWMGAESGSQKILDAMEKNIRVEEIHAAVRNLRRHGIRSGLFLQVGYPGEEWEDIEATIRLVRETQPDDIGVSVSYPLPNTRFYNIVRSRMTGKSNWRESGDLGNMIQEQLPGEIYRAIADALHREVRGTATARELQNAWEKVEQLRCTSC